MARRNWGRGSPPPRGSFEWCGVADMCEPAPPPSNIGKVFEISFTELNAADRWMANIYDSLTYARKVHGDKVITDQDIKEWDAFVAKWKIWRYEQNKFLGIPSSEKQLLTMMNPEQKHQFDLLLNESKTLHDKFVSKGMATIPVPYMGELVVLLRTMPKQMDLAQMRSKLEAGVECGNKLLDQNTAWWQWRKRADSKGLFDAISDAQQASRIYGQSRSQETYRTGDPVFDEFLRRLTKIYIEAAGLYGIVETQKTAKAEAVDEARKQTSNTPSNLLYLLAMAGVSYLGLKWLTRDKIVVRVPDVYPPRG